MKIINNKQRPLVTLTIILTLIDMISVLYYKLSVNGMNLKEYDFNYVGNLITVIIYGVIISGLLLKILKNDSGRNYFRLLIVLTILSFALLFIAVLVVNLKPFHSGEYILGFQALRLIITILFLLKTFMAFYIIMLLWSSIIKFDNWNFLRSIISAFIACSILFVFTFLYSNRDFPRQIEAGKKYEAAVVLGAAVWKKDKPTPLFAARIEKAYDLYKEAAINKILVTGSNAPGELSEAETAYKLLSELGVNSDDIVVENDSRTTIEQLNYLKNKYLPKINYRKVLIITDRFHLSRSTEMCKFLKINHQGIASDYKVNSQKLIFYKIKETIALLVFWIYGM